MAATPFTPSTPRSSKADFKRTIEHVVGAIDGAAESYDPFHHLQLVDVFPADVYSALLQAMPDKADYRHMSGRTKSTRTGGGGGTRVKLDLFPEFVRHLAPEQRPTWDLIGRALCSVPVREAFRQRLRPGLEKRFGAGYRQMGMYPIPILTRDVAGYRIGIHPDTRWKGMTIQLYLPRDHSIQHVGTVFHRRTSDGGFERVTKMPFSPNSGYAFAVGTDTFHSTDTVGPEVETRDSILLTYFVDGSTLQIVRNRAKRLGNLVLNEARRLGLA